jgi:hypothetical protein
MTNTLELGALALVLGLSSSLLSGCEGGATGDWRVCVDDEGHRIPDVRCPTEGRSTGGYVEGSGGASRWAYIDRSSSVPAVGDKVEESAPLPTHGVSYGAAPEGGIARGGFGHGGGEGEGGGHGGGGE